MDADATVAELQEETERWKEKLADRLGDVEAADEVGEDILENARAYHSDAAHFEADDPVRAFEAVVWGWSWLEIGERLGHVQET